MNKSTITNENKFQSESNKTSVSTNINGPSPDHDNYAKENENNEKLSFPLVEIETADSFLNSGNESHSHGTFYDLEPRQRISSNLFDSSTSAIFDESEIDIDNASFVSEISSLAFSPSKISSLQSPTSIQKGQKKRNRNYDKDIGKHGRRKKKNTNKLFPEDDFQFNSPDHFFDYFQSYEDSSMPAVLSKRWHKKSLGLRKEVICAYRAEDTRIINIENEDTQQKLREEEEMRREKIADYDISLASSQNQLLLTTPIYDDQDKELEIDKNHLQLSRSHNFDTDNSPNEIDIQNDQESEVNELDIEFNEDSTLVNKNINPLLIFSLAIRFLFYVGYILNLC